MTLRGTCLSCGAIEREVCNDGYCRPCHKSLSFEDCNSGAYVNRLRARYGLPAVKGDESTPEPR